MNLLSQNSIWFRRALYFLIAFIGALLEQTNSHPIGWRPLASSFVAGLFALRAFEDQSVSQGIERVTDNARTLLQGVAGASAGNRAGNILERIQDAAAEDNEPAQDPDEDEVPVPRRPRL